MARRFRFPSRPPVRDSPNVPEAEGETKAKDTRTSSPGKAKRRLSPLSSAETNARRSRLGFDQPLSSSSDRRRSRFSQDPGSAEKLSGNAASVSNLLKTPSFVSSTSEEAARFSPNGRRRSSVWQTDPAVLRKMKNDLCSLSPPPELSNPPPTTKLWPISVAFIGIIVVLAVIGTVVLRRMYSQKTPGSDVTLCTTYDCGVHALKLTHYLNTKVFPCKNFYEFVCGNRKKESEKWISIEDDMIDQTARHILEELSTSHSTSKPRMLYQECTANTTDSDASLQAFKRFKRERRMTWPEERPLNVHPLDILLDLTINWDMGSWLDVRVVRATKEKPLMIMIHKGALEKSWVFQLQKIQAFEYKNVVETFYQLFGAKKDGYMPSIRQDQFMVLETLLDTTSTLHEEDLLPLRDIERYTPNITARLWLSLLNKHYKPYFNFRENDLVIIKNTGLLRAVATLINTVPTDRLLVAIGWAFIQEYVWMISSPILSIDAVTKRRLCIKTILSCYGLLPGIYYILKTYTVPNREKVDGIVEHTKRRLINLVERSPWIDNATKTTAAEKLERTVAAIWPPDELMDPERFSSLYDSFPNPSGVFFSSYIDVLKKQRALIKDRHFEDVYAKRFSTPHGLISYTYYLNKVTVALTTLSSPAYYNQGTLAMNYGGFASLYAKKLVKALDTEGITVSATGERHMWWEKSSLPEYIKRSACAADATAGPSSSNATVFPWIPALETSFDAYTDAKALGNEASDLRLKNMPDFPSDMIFFISYCHNICSTVKESQRECNVPLMNFPQFAATFRCSPGTYMNPKDKCAFFP